MLNLARAAAGHRRRVHVRDLAGAAGRRPSRAATAARRSACGARSTGASVAVGPLVGGVLTDGIGWESIFFVNVPIGHRRDRAHAARRCTSRATRAAAARLGRARDLLARRCSCSSSRSIRGNAEGWGSPLIVALLIGAAVLLVAFVLVERARRAPDARPHAVPQARRSSARRSPPSCCRRRCSRCSCTSRSTCRTSSATRRSRPACASCPPRSSSFVARAGLGQARRALRRALVHGRRAGGSSALGLLLMTRPRRRATTGPRCSAGFLVAGGGIGLVNPALATTAIGVVDAAARRHGLGHQLDVPPGRDRDRDRRAGARSSSTVVADAPSARDGRRLAATRAAGRRQRRRLHLLRRVRALGQRDARPAGEHAFVTGPQRPRPARRSSPSWARSRSPCSCASATSSPARRPGLSRYAARTRRVAGRRGRAGYISADAARVLDLPRRRRSSRSGCRARPPAAAAQAPARRRRSDRIAAAA